MVIEQKEGIVQVYQKTAKQGHSYWIQYQMADFLIQQFKLMSDEFINIDILKLQLMEKPLDNPLTFTKNIMASLLNIPKQHIFLLLQTQSFFITIDYYKGNRIRVRMG